MKVTLLPRLRRSRWVHILQIIVFASYALNPYPGALSYWTSSSGVKTEVANPPDGDDWYLQDSDGDGLSNAQEAQFGSDPYSIDSDFDGLADSVEYQYSLTAFTAGDPLPYDPWNWDSNGNGFSDFDEFYQQIQGYSPVVNYAGLTQGNYYSYSDADGDGLKNFEDGDPLNMDRDGDGIFNWNEAAGQMDDPYNGAGPPNNAAPQDDPGMADSDGDGIQDANDPFPYGSYWYQGIEYGGSWSDRDGDGIPDPADPFPDGSYWYNNVEYAAPWIDQDGDGIPDALDPWPTISGSYSYNGTDYPGTWSDQDADGVPDPADLTPNGGYYWYGSFYAGPWGDTDGDGTPDPFDPSPNGEPPPPYEPPPPNDPPPPPYVPPYDPPPYDPWGGQPHYNYNGTEYSGYWYDSDSDGIPDAQDATPYGGYWYNGTEYAGYWSDRDGDGIPDPQDSDPYDWWNGAPHYNYQGTEYPGSWTDRDGDGIPDPADAYPDDATNRADTDGDGLSDYDENTQYSTDPSKPDTDDDGLSDYDELFTYHTNPLLAKSDPNQLYPDYQMVDQTDTDGDGIPDRVEQWYASQGYGMNPNDPADASGDLDGDGYTNLQAYRSGWSLTASLNTYDYDQDGILDVLEDAWNAAYPGILNNNNFNDSVEDFDGDGLMNFEEIALGLNPGVPCSRSGSFTDAQEWAWRGLAVGSALGVSFHGIGFTGSVLPEWQVMTDGDSDSVPDGLLAFVTAITADATLVTLPSRLASGDYDGDGMPDRWEHRYNLDLRDASNVLTDPDGDGLTNLSEYRFQSNPLARDTNHDNVDDATRLYDTSITPRSLNGLTTRYQPQLVADYTRTANSGMGSFSPYADGEPEDPPPPTEKPSIETIEVSQRFHFVSLLEDYYEQGVNMAGGAIFTDLSEFPVVSAYSSGLILNQSDVVDPIGPEQWMDSTQIVQNLKNDAPIWLYSDPYGYRFNTAVQVRPYLTEIDRSKDHNFTFEKFYSDRPSEKVTLTIKAGQQHCANYEDGIAEASPNGWAKMILVESTDDPDPQNPNLIGSISASDSAGSRYRKVSLNGLPLPDAKPQVQDESGEREEETQIDAFNRHLQHSVTDIYASDPSTLLPLSVRRDVTSESWTKVSGLRPSERPDLPFGPCWSSNLCAYVRFEETIHNPDLPVQPTDKPVNPIRSAEVHDEQGTSQRFLAWRGTNNWQHSREEMSNAQTKANTFDGLVLRKKFGTTCTYTPCNLIQLLPTDRIKGDEEHKVRYSYARLSEVKDRLGNRLLYEYPDENSLIPNRVYDPDRAGRQIFIMHNNGRVSAVRGPAGEEVQYNNLTGGLTSATRGNAVVKYTYQNSIESKDSVNNPTANVDARNAYYHTELASITDERNNTYSFAYQYDNSVPVIQYGEVGTTPIASRRLGMPMQIVQVALPDGQVVYLSGARDYMSLYSSTTSASDLPAVTTQVSGPAGTFGYAFSQPYVYKPTMANPGLDDDVHSLTITVTYTRMEITSAGGTESFTFNPAAMFALSSATDLSGNTHSFSYGADGFDDPVRETDALGNFKDFSYDPTTRVMSSMTDQTGVVTSYQIQPGNGLKLSETVTGAGGAVERQSTFQYNHPTYHGFMTQSTVDASTADTAPPTVTTYTLGGGTTDWAQVTETTQTATGPVSTTTVHDLSGNKRSVIDGRGMVTNFDYDAHLRLVQVTHPDNSHKNLAYDLHGNLIREINEKGTSTFHDYDVFNRRIKTTLDLNGNGTADNSYGTSLPVTNSSSVTYGGDIVTTSTYNARGQVLTQTDPRGKVTAHTYDNAGRLTRTDDGGLVTTMEYGANSGGSVFDSSGFKPTRITDPRGTETALTYDKMYRTTAQTVTYHNDVPTDHVLHAMADSAQQTYQQACTLAREDSITLQAATITLYHATLRCDLPAASAAVDAAAASLEAVREVQTDNATAIGLADQELQAAKAALNEAQAMADDAVASSAAALEVAQQASGAAAAALNSAASAIQDASNLNDTAQQNAATQAAAIDEVIAQAGYCADKLTAAMAAVDAAQAAVDSATTGMGGAVDESEAASWSAQLEWAFANLASANASLASAQAAKASADAAVADAISAASSAASAATDAANAYAVANSQGSLSDLQSAASQAQMNAASAQSAYDNAVQNAQNALAEPQAVLATKTDLFNAATGSALAAQNDVNQAQEVLDAVSLDLQMALAAADDPDAMASLQAELADVQSDFDSATAALTAQQAIVAAAASRSNAAQQRWQSVSGDNGSHTASTSTQYDAAGRPIRVTDALGRVALTVYDVFGQIQRVTHPDGTIVSTDYTHHGKPWRVVDELGNLTQTEFDAAGRAVKTIAPAVNGVSATTTVEYDAASNAIRATDPLGRVTESQYDERNRAVAIYAPPVWDAQVGAFVRPSTQTTYDALGQVVAVTDPQGHMTSHNYDRAGRNWRVIAPAVDGIAPTTVTKFDPGGLALSVTNPRGLTVTNTYDLHGRLTQTVDAAGIVNTFAYDAVGNRTSVKDGKNQETTFGYDGLNRLTWQTFANGDTSNTSYDALRKLSQTSPRGITTSYTYDSRDRVLTTSAPGIHRQFSYDIAGHLLSVTEAGNTAANVAYTYDALGRVLTETSRGVQHSYSYDIAGNRIRADYGTGRSVQTSYDALNRPESIVEGGRATRYGYDLGGRAVMLVAGNGQTSQNSYDALGRLVDRTLFKSTAMNESEVLAQFSWTHDALGNVTQQLETWPGSSLRTAGVRSTTMTYDADNRLASETVSDPATGVTTTAYAYDAANNRLQKSVTGGSDPGVWHYTYNEANQLTSWEQRDVNGGTLLKSASLGYDASGNRISQSVSNTGGATGSGITPPPAASGTTSYQWDAQDRLSSVTLPDGTQHAYDYDYRTRRIGTHKLVSAVQQAMTAIVFAGGLSLAEFDTTTDSLPAKPTVEYTRGPDMGGGVGGMLYSLRSGGTKYSLSNGRGDIVAQADSSATLTWTASYEAYGRRTTETGVNQDKQRGNSKDEDPTGLLNEGFRYRDLEAGVWLSRDPAGFVDGPNVYAYVRQNPWTSWDPHGLQVNSKTEKRVNEKSGKKYDHTVIKMNVVVADLSKGKKKIDGTYEKRTEKEMNDIRDRIKKGIEDTWTKEWKDKNGDITRSVETHVEIEVASSAKDRKESNAHVIGLVDEVKNDPGRDMVGRVDKVGGKQIAIESEVVDGVPLSPELTLEWASGHEVGHAMGLQHPFPMTRDKIGKIGFDNTNPLIKDMPSNVMGYTGFKDADPAQIDHIQKRYDQKLLNLPFTGWGPINQPVFTPQK